MVINTRSQTYKAGFHNVRKNLIKILLSFSGLCIFNIVPAYAGTLSVGAMHEYINSDETQLLKRIRNNGSTTDFIRVSVAQIDFKDGKEVDVVPDNDGKQDESALKCLNSSTHQSAYMFPSPSRLIIPARGMQASRLIFCGPRDKEHYFRVRFIPALPQHVDDFPAEAEEKKRYKQALTAGVNVLTGYGVIVIVRPQVTRFNTLIKEVPGGHNISNAGNSIIILNQMKTCEKQVPTKCNSSQKIHIRPGQQRVIPAQKNHFTQFILNEGVQNKEIRL